MRITSFRGKSQNRDGVATLIKPFPLEDTLLRAAGMNGKRGMGEATSFKAFSLEDTLLRAAGFFTLRWCVNLYMVMMGHRYKFGVTVFSKSSRSLL